MNVVQQKPDFRFAEVTKDNVEPYPFLVVVCRIENPPGKNYLKNENDALRKLIVGYGKMTDEDLVSGVNVGNG